MHTSSQSGSDTMRQTLAQRIIQLNNEAIVSALKGFRQDGVVTLQRALALVASIQESKAVVVNPCSAARRQTYTVPLSKDLSSKHCDDIFQFFNRAITLSTDNESLMNLSCPHSRTRIQATILFNLGVFCHMEAVCSGSSSLARHNALQFYGGAYQVLEHAARTYGSHQDDSLLLILGLFNNMGHIHSSFGSNSDQTRQCVRWMQSSFASPLTQHALSSEDYAFFSQYISVRADEQLLISPAA